MKTRNKTGVFFECKVSFMNTMEDGCTKRVQEIFVVEAQSFADAEARAYGEYGHHDELFIEDIKRAKYSEIFLTDEAKHDKFFNVTVEFTTIDEKTGKEKCKKVQYLTQADTFDCAKTNITDVMNGSMCDYKINSIKETKIYDVFES